MRRGEIHTAGKIYYVAPDGNDSYDGSENTPFATFKGAKDAILVLKSSEGLPDGGITVYFKSGTYKINSTLEFTEDDSGEYDKPIIYSAAKDAEVIFDGGTVLNAADFKPTSDDVKAQLLDKNAAEHLLEIDLEAAGCYDLTDAEYTSGWTCYEYRQELYVDNKRQTVARWPNCGFAVSEGSDYNTESADASFRIPEEKAKMLAGLSSFRYFGCPLYDWSTNLLPLDRSNVDLNSSSIVLKKFGQSIRSDGTYYFFNVLPELDIPGEYYWDVKGKKLYYYPEGDLTGRKIVFSQYAKKWFNLNRASNIVFSGFTFENGRSSIFGFEGIASVVKDVGNVSENITIKDCTFRCLGAYAIEIYGRNNIITGNKIYELGSGAISVCGGTLDGLIPSNTVVSDNLIHDWSQTYTVYNAGVTASGFGFQISHNEFYNSPHEAIAFNCGGTVIEYNYVHDVCRQTSDAGAIYSGRRWEWGGNKIRFNYIKNIIDVTCGGMPNGIYLDDCLSDQECYGNIIENVGGLAFLVGGGKYNKLYNNVMINCGNGGILVDDRGQGWAAGSVAYPDGSMWVNLIHSNYLAYLNRYYFPKNLIFIENTDAATEDCKDMSGNASYTEAYGNVAMGCCDEEALKKAISESLNPKAVSVSVDGCAVDFSTNTVLYGMRRDNITYIDGTDLGFSENENGIRTLKDDSVIYRDTLNFVKIPFDEIGLLK